jgi:hypothetical protein
MAHAVNDHSRIKARQRLEGQRAALVEAKQAGPACLRCRYRAISGICTNIAFREQVFDYELGKLAEGPSTTTAKEARRGLCGPDALLFDPVSLATRAKEIGAAIALAGLGALILL